jgi:hypothetical protein
MNGKGDNRRPASVLASEMQARWAATFDKGVREAREATNAESTAICNAVFPLRPTEDQ